MTAREGEHARFVGRAKARPSKLSARENLARRAHAGAQDRSGTTGWPFQRMPGWIVLESRNCC